MSSALTKLKRKYRAAIKNTARDFMLDFKRYYNEAIDAFYNDYEPLKYKRTYMTYAASSLNKGYINPATEGESFLAEITVSPENIPGEPYMNRVTPFGGITGEESKKEIIFPRTFVKGIHGINRNDNLTRVRRNRYRKKRYVPKNIFLLLNLYSNYLYWVENHFLQNFYHYPNNLQKKFLTRNMRQIMVARLNEKIKLMSIWGNILKKNI